MKKEDFSKELLDLLDQYEKPQVATEILKRMEVFALEQISEVKKFPKLTLVGIAASMLLLLSANFMVVQNTSEDSSIAQTQSKTAYDLIPAKSLYHE